VEDVLNAQRWARDEARRLIQRLTQVVLPTR
jgi:hypothetical protein